ncbi:MAG: hypothetical protein MJ201_05665, partial [Mycoplasmoidaceae bacterium]|nr:hypothetical protein [Mycoplasmoidaceae bacterium]
YNLINKEFDVVVMTKNEIKQLDKNEHYVVLLSKQHPDHGDGPKGPRKPKITLSDVLKEMRNGFKKQEQFNNEIINRLDNLVSKNNLVE